MKTVSTETLKKLAFIPMLNIFCPFISVYNCIIEKKGSGFAIFAMMFVTYLPFFILMQISAENFPQFSKLITLLSAYFPMLLSGLLMAKYQERLGF